MSAENVAIVRRWMDEVWNQGQLETVYELLDEDSVCYSEAGELRGPEPFLENVYKPLSTAFSDIRVTVEAAVAERDEVVVRWHCRAAHTGDGLGFPPTGKQVSFRGVTWTRIKDGKLHEGWDIWNQAGLMQTLATGTPPPPSMMCV